MADVGIVITAKEQVTAAAGRASGAMDRLGDVASKAGGGLSALRGVMGGVTGALGSIVGAAMSAVKAIGVALVGAVAAAVGAFMLLKRGLQTMRESVERVSDRVGSGGMGRAMEAAAKNSERLGSSVARTADTLEDAGKKMDVVVGAFGDVGAGFIQRAGAVTDAVKEQADRAGKAARAATAALEKTDAAVGGSVRGLSRFGAALDRIATAWQNAKDQILTAIAIAITPAIEALAVVMESEAFQVFVDLLAEDLAAAAESVAEWFVDDVIPALEDFIDAVNRAGGPMNYLRTRMDFVRRSIVMLIVNAVRPMLAEFDKVKNELGPIAAEIARIAENLGIDLGAIFSGIFDGLLDSLSAPLITLERLSQRVFDAIGRGLSGLPDWFRELIFGNGEGGGGGGGGGGDNEPASMNAPLRGDQSGGGLSVQVYVTAPNGTNAQAFGSGVAGGMLNEMRRRGIRVPTLA